VWYDWFVCVAWPVHMCGMDISCMWHDSFLWKASMCDVTQFCVCLAWHDLFICVTWLVHISERILFAENGSVWHDSFLCACVAWPCNIYRRLIYTFRQLYHIALTATHCNTLQHTATPVQFLVCMSCMTMHMCYTRRLYICGNMTHSSTRNISPSDMWHDSFLRACIAWPCICDTWALMVIKDSLQLRSNTCILKWFMSCVAWPCICDAWGICEAFVHAKHSYRCDNMTHSWITISHVATHIPMRCRSML